MDSESISENRVPRRHIYEVDIVRFLAAVSVVVFHLSYKAFAVSDDVIHKLIQTHAYYAPPSIAGLGWIGVQVFFVISGFVIAYSSSAETLDTYLRRRVLRLVPGVWGIVPICTVIAIIVFGEAPGSALTQALKTLFFVPIEPWIIGQFWTLPIEIAFYACVSVLLYLKRPEKLELFGIVLGLYSSAYWFADCFVHFSSHGQQFMRLCLLQHGIFFAMGITIFKAGASRLSLGRLAFLGVMAVAAFLQISWSAQWEAATLDPTFRSWTAFLIWGVATCILCFASVRRRDSKTNPHFASLIRTLGLATYPLYLLHFHVGGAILILALRLGISVNISIVFAVVSSIVAAVLVAQFVEPPIRLFMQQWSALRSPASTSRT